MKIYLASTSPRRRELISLLKIPFEVVAPNYEEISDPNLSPKEEVLLFAREKARSLQEDIAEGLIIGCDTLVALDGEKFGKPASEPEAVQMLQKLSGKYHEVWSGLALLKRPKNIFLETAVLTKIKMRNLSEEEIRQYVASGEPLGKAGAYALQGKGSELIEKVDGDAFSVIGLPLKDLIHLLETYGNKISSEVKNYLASQNEKFCR